MKSDAQTMSVAIQDKTIRLEMGCIVSAFLPPPARTGSPL
jgi:hypothetical protein